MTTVHVGFVGTGNIGEPMVQQLVAAGTRTSVFARRREVADRLAAAGAELVAAPQSLAACNVVVSCLFTDAQVLEVCPPIIERMAPGSVFVSHTTGSPHSLTTLSRQARARGVSVVEAPFSGTPDAVRARTLTVLLAGDEQAVETAAATVDAYASTVIRTGALGTALPAKLLNNALFAACTQLTLSALDAARSVGISEETLLEVLSVSSGGSAAARYISASGKDARTYSSTLLRYLVKDLDSARSVAAELGADISPILAAAERGPMDLLARGDALAAQ